MELGLRGTAAGEMEWDVSSWDVAGSTWSGLEPTWAALDGCEVEQATIERGRDRALARNRAGTAEVGLVWREPGDRWSFRPTSPVELGQEIRLRASVDGAQAIPLYRGTVRRIRDGWDADTGEFRITLQTVDRLADLAAVDLPERPVEGLADLTHARINRILALAGIDLYFAHVGVDADSSGDVPHASSNFARNLLDEAMVAVESDAGADLLVDRDGLITLRRGEWWLPAGASVHPRWNVTRATWTNKEELLGDDTFAPVAFATGQDLDDVRNQVSMARGGGSAITLSDSNSVLRYGLRTYQRFDLTCQLDVDVTAVAALYLAELKDRTDRVDALEATLDPRASTAALARWIDLELGDRHAIRWADGAGELQGTFHLFGIRHSLTATDWNIRLDLWAYSALGMEPPILSTWGAGSSWGSSTWGGA